MEIHLTVEQIAKRWQCGRDTVVRHFSKLVGHGVINIGSPASVRRRKRQYLVLRIPPEVLERVEKELGR
jgi:hypothetical protein